MFEYVFLDWKRISKTILEKAFSNNLSHFSPKSGLKCSLWEKNIHIGF
jgi:hypothetical protein